METAHVIFFYCIVVAASVDAGNEKQLEIAPYETFLRSSLDEVAHAAEKNERVTMGEYCFYRNHLGGVWRLCEGLPDEPFPQQEAPTADFVISTESQLLDLAQDEQGCLIVGLFPTEPRLNSNPSTDSAQRCSSSGPFSTTAKKSVAASPRQIRRLASGWRPFYPPPFEMAQLSFCRGRLCPTLPSLRFKKWEGPSWSGASRSIGGLCASLNDLLMIFLGYRSGVSSFGPPPHPFERFC
jgi:hypothetical protein